MTLSRPQLVAAGLALLAGLVVLYWIIASTVHAPPAALASLKRETARPAPSVSFVDVAGRSHSLNEYRGRYVLLNLWGTWCAPCARELPALARLSRAMSRSRMVVVAVALPPGDAKAAQAFLSSHGAGALAAYDDSQTMFLRAFRAYGLPLTVLIDPNGQEIARAYGAARWDAPEAIAYLGRVTG